MLEIGIDLGTSNSLIGYFNQENNQAELIPNRFGKYLTPSVVGLADDGTIIVGEIAKARQSSHPEATAHAFKRSMGSEQSYKLDHQQFSALELSSFVLRALRADAEAFLKTTVDAVVISVPAYFNAFQREATVSAAKLAGLTVTQLISEPTAASLAYGIENSNTDQNFLVVDLGGGTYDVSLISMFEQIIQVEAISGDVQLGGEDFTALLANTALEQAGILKPTANLWSEVYAKAEVMKRKFSDSLTLAAGFDFELANGKLFNFTQTSVEFRNLINQPLLARLKNPIRRVMHDSRMDFNELDEVILVGGATRLLVVQEAFEMITGITPNAKLNPDEVVALGATIRAHMLNDRMRAGLIMTDVIGFSLGTAVVDADNNDFFKPIIERNSVIPISKEVQVRKLSDRQKRVAIKIYQGEHSNVDENLMLGEIDYPVAALTTNDEIKIRYSYDESGILEVLISDSKQGITKELVIQNRNTKLSEQAIAQIQKKLDKLKINPIEQDENKLLLARFDQVYTELLGAERENIQAARQTFINEVASGNLRRIKQAQTWADEVLTSFESLL